MIKTIINTVVLGFRYLVNVSTLSLAVLLRYRIGSDCYAPWSWKPHGKGEGCYRPKGWVRFWFVIVLFLWIRLFMVLSIAHYSPGFDPGMWSEWSSLLEQFWSASYFKSDVYGQGSGAGFFYVLSYVVVIVALLQLLISEEIIKPNLRPRMDSLGRSLLFGWLLKYQKQKGSGMHHHIRGTIEPFLVAVMGCIFYAFEYSVHGYFFWMISTSMAFQAHFFRSRERREKRELENDLKEGDKDKLVLRQLAEEKIEKSPGASDSVATMA